MQEQTFKAMTDHIPQSFESKQPEYRPFVFAGRNIARKKKRIFLEQNNYTEKVEKLNENASFEDFRTTRLRLAWINLTRPKILVDVNIVSEVTKDIFQQDLKFKTKIIKHLKKYTKLGLKRRITG